MLSESLTGLVLDGRFRVGPTLGHGGMGVVYSGDDLVEGGQIAIKVLDDCTPQVRARVEREIQLTALMQSPHVVRLIDAGECPDGRPYLVMERLVGPALGDVMRRRGPWPPAEALAIIDGVLLGLGVAHAHGIVHRDVKPGNIHLEPDRGPVLLDFGLARGYQAGAIDLTGTGVAAGTPRYMAPEQLRNERPDGRADLYGVGALLFELCTGRTPFEPDDPGYPDSVAQLPGGHRVIWAHMHRPPPALTGVSPALSTFVARLLTKDRTQRPSSVTQLMTALREMPEGAALPPLDAAMLATMEPATIPLSPEALALLAGGTDHTLPSVPLNLPPAETIAPPPLPTAEPPAAPVEPPAPRARRPLSPWLWLLIALGVGMSLGAVSVALFR